MIMPGKIKIDKMIPICAETLHLLPEAYHLPNASSIWDYTQEEMYTRKDDEKNEHLRVLIAPQTRALLEVEAAGKRAQVDAPLEDETGSKQQMMYYTETLAAGTPFAWSIILQDVTDAELEAFGVALAEWSKAPYIGAKSNVGLGKVALDIIDFALIDSRMSATSTAIDMPAGTAYMRHLRDNAAAIRDLLRDFA
jgi:hypothetical protein